MKDYLIINRAKWRTGGTTIYNDYSTGKGYTALLNEEGYMCCLGFRCEQMGIPKENLLGKSSPENLSDDWDIPDLIDFEGKNTSFVNEAIKINDNTMLLDKKTREKEIKEHFATIGVTVEFTGKYK